MGREKISQDEAPIWRQFGARDEYAAIMAGMRRYIIGMIVGCAVWAVLFAVGYPYVTGSGFLPRFAGPIGFVAAVASMPIGFGGWVFVWGDGAGQPPAFVNRVWFNVVSGLFLYGSLGAIAGAIYGRLRKKRSG